MALLFHLEAYKKLECGTRKIGPRVRRLCVLTEREHVRALYSASDMPGGRQVFSTPERVLGRLDALERAGKTTDQHGKHRIRYVSLCSGIEGATAALERLGSSALPVAFSEVDGAANAVLRYRWPEVPRVGDMAQFDWAALRGRVDLVLGGPPCQSFSVAGRRLGLSDPRGNLAIHFLRSVGAMQPRWVVFENVPGMLSSNGGTDFECFLSAVEELGYACAWRILDARYFGLPQRRRRLWLVAERAGSGCGPVEILALGKGEAGSSGKGRAAWKTPAARTENCAGDLTHDEQDIDWSDAVSWLSARRPDPAGIRVALVVPQGDLLAFQPLAGAKARTIGASTVEAPTLASRSGGNRVPAVVYAADLRHGTLAEETMTLQTGPESGWSLNATPCAVEVGPASTVVRRFSPLECLRLQGYDDDWLDGVRVGGRPLTDSDRYRLTGNAWPVPVASWILERLLAYIDNDLAPMGVP